MCYIQLLTHHRNTIFSGVSTEVLKTKKWSWRWERKWRRSGSALQKKVKQGLVQELRTPRTCALFAAVSFYAAAVGFDYPAAAGCRLYEGILHASEAIFCLALSIAIDGPTGTSHPIQSSRVSERDEGQKINEVNSNNSETIPWKSSYRTTTLAIWSFQS